MEFLKQIAVDAPRLRYLELRVHLARVGAAYAGWLVRAYVFFSAVARSSMPDSDPRFPQDNIPGALASLPLVGLRLHIGEMPGVDLQMINGAQWHTLDNAIYGPSKALAQQLYSARVETARSLPCRLAEAIRSFRVVAIADGQTELGYDGTPFFERPRGSVRPSLPVGIHRVNLDEYANQNFWYLEPVMTLEWWRIVRDGDEIVRVDALTANQGKRVQRFFEGSDLEALDRIDGELLTFALNFGDEQGLLTVLTDFLSEL